MMQKYLDIYWHRFCHYWLINATIYAPNLYHSFYLLDVVPHYSVMWLIKKN